MFAQRVVPFVHITTKIPDWPNDGMLSRVGGRGFPTVRFLSADGEVLGQPQGRSVESFEAALDDLEAFFAAEARVEQGEDAALNEYLVRGTWLERIEFERAQELVGRVGDLDRRERAELDEAMAALEFRALVARTNDDIVELGPRLAEMYEERRIPGRWTGFEFFEKLTAHAELARDRRLFGAALRDAQRRYGKDPRYRQWFRDARKRGQQIR